MRLLKHALLMVSLLFSAVAMLGILSLRSLQSVEVACVGTPAGNGDVNGDGRLDISDPIYLVNFLFQGGPQPCALADSPELVARVKTLEERIREPCEHREEGRFVDNGGETFTDLCTGLTWKLTHHDVDGDGDFELDFLTLADAQKYAANLELGGFDDWRVPTTREMDSLLRVSNGVFQNSNGPIHPGVPVALCPANPRCSNFMWCSDSLRGMGTWTCALRVGVFELKQPLAREAGVLPVRGP